MSATVERLLRIWWVASLCALAFAYGVAVGLFKFFPYHVLQSLAAAGRDLVQFPRHTLRLSPDKFLAEAPPEGGGVTVNIAGLASPGITLVTGYFDGGNGIRLIDLDGRTLNEWRISYNAVFPESPHLADQPHDWDTQLHGAMLLPDGDVVFTFQYAGLVRMDRCGRVKWALPRQTHHLFALDGDGNFWVPGRIQREEAIERYPDIPVPFQEEYVLEVSPDGRVLREISILGTLFDSKAEGLLFPSGTHEPGLVVPFSGDFTHLNDVEVLSPELAPEFPMFEPGDLLLSLRNLDLLMVVRPSTGRIVWSRTGPYLRQHDPDFLPSGRIAVFDNRRDDHDGRVRGGSRILSLEPSTGRIETQYGAGAGQFFYTNTMGEKQQLPNGDLLISESNRGRAFEVDAQGTVVWSYVNRWKDGSVGQIAQATRYPAGYFHDSPKEPCHE